MIRKIENSKYIQYILLLIILLASLLINIYRLGERSLWLDEGFSYYYASTFFSDFKSIIINDSNMLFYYFLLHFWLLINNSEFFIRLLSVVFSLASLPFVYFIAKKLFNIKTALLSVFLISFNIVFITYAQEARSYSLLIFLSTLSNYLYLKFLSNFSNHKIFVFYLIINILLIYSHFFGLWVILAQLLFGIIFYKNKYKYFLLIGTVTTITFLPLLLISEQNARLQWIDKPTWRSMLDIYYFFFGGKNIIYLFFLSGILFIINQFKLKFMNIIKKYKEITYLVIQFSIPVLAAYIVSITYEPLFIYRYLISILVPLFILFAYFIFQIKSKFLIISILFAFISFSYMNLDRYYTYYEKENWKAVFTDLNKNIKDGDTIILYIADLYYPLNYYSLNKKVTYLQIQKVDYDKLPIINSNRSWLIMSHTGKSIEAKNRLEIFKYNLSQQNTLLTTKNYEGVSVAFYNHKKL